MKIYIKTERLLLRSWIEQDLEPYATLNADPEVMEFFPSPLSHKESMDHVDRIRTHFNTHDFGPFAVEIIKSKKFIGFVGLGHLDMNVTFCPTVEIGWRLSKDSWGKAYATEAALACIHYGFNVLKLPVIHSFTALINKRSERIMEKIAMTRVGEFDHPKIDSSHILYRHVLYEITKDQFIKQG